MEYQTKWMGTLSSNRRIEMDNNPRASAQISSLVEDCLDKIGTHYEDEEADDGDHILIFEYIAGKLKIIKDIVK